MATERRITPEFTLEKSKTSIWVNGKVNCLGRFTPLGFEINRELREGEDPATTGHSLAVTMKNTTVKEWNNFVTLMMEHHGIDLSEETYPGVL